MASHSVNNETQRSLTYAFGKGLAPDVALRHKSDPCLGSSPKIKIFGDPEKRAQTPSTLLGGKA